MQTLLMFFFKRYVNKKGNNKKFKVVKLIASLPAIKTFAQQSYYLSGLTHKGLIRYKEFIFILIVITLYADAIE